MAVTFTKRIWQQCICQPNELKREIKKTTGGTNQKSGRPWPTQAPLRIATAINLCLQTLVTQDISTSSFLGYTLFISKSIALFQTNWKNCPQVVCLFVVAFVSKIGNLNHMAAGCDKSSFALRSL